MSCMYILSSVTYVYLSYSLMFFIQMICTRTMKALESHLHGVINILPIYWLKFPGSSFILKCSFASVCILTYSDLTPGAVPLNGQKRGFMGHCKGGKFIYILADENGGFKGALCNFFTKNVLGGDSFIYLFGSPLVTTEVATTLPGVHTSKKYIIM